MNPVVGCSGRVARVPWAEARALPKQRHRTIHLVAAAGEWSYAPYPPGSDWAVAQGAYPDPRGASPAGSRPRPPSERPTDGPSTSYDGGQSAQDSDPLSEVVRIVVDGVTGFLASVVSMMSDWALSLLPQHVKRRAVENSIKGALALLGLALLQSVLSLVLTVGTVALAVYAAHQVFGLQLPFLPGAAGGKGAGAAEAQAGNGHGQVDPRFYGGGVPPQAGYGPYQQVYGQGYYGGYQGPRGQPNSTRPGAAGGWAQPPRAAGQGPVIDVYYEGP